MFTLRKVHVKSLYGNLILLYVLLKKVSCGIVTSKILVKIS